MSKYSPYYAYSALSMADAKDSKDFDDLIHKAENIRNLVSADSAKSYIKENWGLEGNANAYFLAPDCFLNIKDSKKLYYVNFILKNENISYYFNK